jgi:hypothetical protein
MLFLGIKGTIFFLVFLKAQISNFKIYIFIFLNQKILSRSSTLSLQRKRPNSKRNSFNFSQTFVFLWFWFEVFSVFIPFIEPWLSFSIKPDLGKF